jgi:hypothetical protein
MSIFTREDLRRSRDGIPKMKRVTRSDPKGECKVKVWDLDRLKIEHIREINAIKHDTIEYYEV